MLNSGESATTNACPITSLPAPPTLTLSPPCHLSPFTVSNISNPNPITFPPHFSPSQPFHHQPFLYHLLPHLSPPPLSLHRAATSHPHPIIFPTTSPLTVPLPPSIIISPHLLNSEPSLCPYHERFHLSTKSHPSPCPYHHPYPLFPSPLPSSTVPLPSTFNLSSQPYLNLICSAIALAPPHVCTPLKMLYARALALFPP